jgi:hypothetical protein
MSLEENQLNTKADRMKRKDGGRKDLPGRQKKKATKMAILSPSLLVIALNVNELNTRIKTSFG